MKRTLLFLFACGMAVCHAHAQDTTTVSRIDFKYNENGAIIKVAPYVEGTEESSMMTKKRSGLVAKQDFIVIKKVKGADRLYIQSVGIPNDSKASLHVCTTSGIKMYSAEKEVGQLVFDLSSLPKGSYVISVEVNGEKESVKYLSK